MVRRRERERFELMLEEEVLMKEGRARCAAWALRMTFLLLGWGFGDGRARELRGGFW